MKTDEKIAVGVALVVVFALFISFLPAFWSESAQHSLSEGAQAAAPTLDITP